LSTAPNGRKENILTSWKEIAAYLDRDVRTCVRWEKRYGLPVHRLERDSKAKVFAYKEQIDEWLAARSAQAGNPAVCELPLRSRFKLFPILFALAGLAAAAYFLFFNPGRRQGTGVPADFHLSGSKLIIVDKAGRELWPYETGLPNLEPEEVYRPRSEKKQQGEDYISVWPYILIRDLDGDGRTEVLFSTQTTSEIGEGRLICLDQDGAVRWRFDMGRALEFGGRPFHGDYRIFGFDVDDYDGDGQPEVLVIAHHMPDWPCQILLLGTSGAVEGEYWNAGYIMDASAGDVDGDGRKELVLGGVNNEYRRGCVAVFKAGGLRGGSPQTAAGYRSPDIGAGGQSVYILFPKTSVHRAWRQEGDPVNYFWIRDADGLTAMTTDTQIYYDLGPKLACRNITISNTFWNLYGELLRQGKVSPIPDEEAYRKSLSPDFRFYREGRWDVLPPVDLARLREAVR
jgi:hypothetical protein